MITLSQSFKYVRQMAVVALGILALSTIASKPGSADQPVASPITSLDQPGAASSNIAGVYMARVARNPCLSGSSTCAANFPALPDGSALIITNVSCEINVLQPLVLTAVALFAAQPTALSFNQTNVGTANYYAVTEAVLSVIAAGRRPSITLWFSGNIAQSNQPTMECTIAGHLASP